MANQDPSWSNIENDEVITYNDLQKWIDANGIIPKNASVNLNTLYGDRCVPTIELDNLIWWKAGVSPSEYHAYDLALKRDIAPRFPTYQIDFCHRDYFGWQGLLSEDKANKNYYNDDTYVYNVGEDIAIAAIIYNNGEAPSSADTFIRFNIPTGMVTSSAELSGIRIASSEIVVIAETSTYIDIKVTKSIPAGDGLGYAVCLVLYHQYPLSLGINPYTIQFSCTASSKYVTNSPFSFTRNTKWEYPVFDVQLTTDYGVNTYIPYQTNFHYIADIKSTNNAHTHRFTFRFDYAPYVSFVGTSEMPADWTVNHDATNRVIFVTSIASNELYPPNYYRIAFLFTTIDCNKDIYATGRAYSENSLSIVSKQIYNKTGFSLTQTLENQNYSYCPSGGCTGYYVYKDVNACSSTYNHYILVNINNSADRIDYGTTAPANTGNCNYSASYNQVVGTRCKFGTNPCTTLTVFKNTNGCFTGDQYQTSDGVIWASNPTTSDCDFNSSNYTNLVGVYCPAGQCTTYNVYKSTNPCFIGDQYYSPYNGGTTFPSQPVNQSCNANPNYNSYLGQICFTGDCSPKNVYMNSQPCFFGNQYYIPETGLTYSTNPMTTGAPCRTTPDIQYVNYSTCSGCAMYMVYKDLNPCSSTYNHYFVNGNDVGTAQPPTGNCVTTPTYTYQGYSTCVSCHNRNVYKDTNPCSYTYNHYFYNDGSYVDVGLSAPSSAICSCNCNLVLITNDTPNNNYAYYSYYTCGGVFVEAYADEGFSNFVCYDTTMPSNFNVFTVDFQGYC
jgi:hypothetical protein